MELGVSHVRHLQNARAHLRQYGRRTFRPSAMQFEETDEAVQELTSALEELQSANDELIRQSELLASTQRRFEELFQGAPDAHVVTDQFGNIRQANQAAAVLLRCPIARLEHKPLIVFLHPVSRKAFRDLLPHLHEQPSNHEFEYIIKPRAGPEFPSASTISTQVDSETGQVRFHWQIRDVRERWNAEKRMRDLARLTLLNREQERKRISDALCGDIGQILVTLSMHLDTLSMTVTPEQSPLRVGLETVRVHLQEAVAGVELLAGGLYPSKLELLGLDATLRDYCASLARQRNLAVEYTGSSVEGLPDSRRVLLFRILRAALDRAAQYDHARSIRVSLDIEGQRLWFIVEEQAVRFDGHLLDSTAFSQDASSRSEKEDSRGISEIRGLLELLGGTMDIRAQPGPGHRITVSLPITYLQPIVRRTPRHSAACDFRAQTPITTGESHRSH